MTDPFSLTVPPLFRKCLWLVVISANRRWPLLSQSDVTRRVAAMDSELRRCGVASLLSVRPLRYMSFTRVGEAHIGRIGASVAWIVVLFKNVASSPHYCPLMYTHLHT